MHIRFTCRCVQGVGGTYVSHLPFKGMISTILSFCIFHRGNDDYRKSHKIDPGKFLDGVPTICCYIAYIICDLYNSHVEEACQGSRPIQWPQKKSLHNQSENFFYIDLFTNLDLSVAVSVRWEESKLPCILSVLASHLPAKHSNCHSTRAQRVFSPPSKCIPVQCSTTSPPPHPLCLH